MDLNLLPLEGENGLVDLLKTITDPRKPRGVRHPVVSILAIAACASLTGAKSFRAIAEWASDQTLETLARLGCKRPKAPSEPSIRRVLQRSDAKALDQAIGGWLAQLETPAGKAIALDGKALRRAHDCDKPAPILLSAVLQKEGLVLAQVSIPDSTNEIPMVKPLLDPLDLRGSVVTADALHTQVETARYLVEEKGADYLFTVKGNQPTLKADIETLPWGAFPPSVHQD